jgi:hypothetical protein
MADGIAVPARVDRVRVAAVEINRARFVIARIMFGDDGNTAETLHDHDRGAPLHQQGETGRQAFHIADAAHEAALFGLLAPVDPGLCGGSQLGGASVLLASEASSPDLERRICHMPVISASACAVAGKAMAAAIMPPARNRLRAMAKCNPMGCKLLNAAMQHDDPG